MLISLLGCAETPPQGWFPRGTPPTEGTPAGRTLTLSSPVYTIPPYTEIVYCYFGSYQGPDLGVVSLRQEQDAFGHHVQLDRYDPPQEGAFEDGDALDCTAGVPGTALLFQATPTQVDGVRQAGLPEGMAMYLGHGQRWVLESHYTNSSGDTLQVQDDYVLEVVDADGVTAWAASWLNAMTPLIVPPGVSSARMECLWEADFTLLSLWGHIHESGRSVTVEHGRGDDWSLIYEVLDWDPAWTNAPEALTYDPGSFAVEAGDVFAVTCTWDNGTGAEIAFPSEMCGAQGVGYSSKMPIDCSTPAVDEDDEDDEDEDEEDD